MAAWLWRNGYSSADNSSLPTGNLGKHFNGTEYSFVQLSYNVQRSTTGIENLFYYWRHTVQVRRILSFVIESEVVYETNPGLSNCDKENCSIYCFIYEATKPLEFLSSAYILIGKINFSRKLLLQLECI